MTHSDSITLSLDLKPSELEFPLEDFVELGFSKLVMPYTAQIFYARFVPKQTICPACGSVSEHHKVHAYNTSEVLLTPSGHRPRVLRLTKTKFICEACEHLFTPVPYFIEPGANIASTVKASILFDFRYKMSMKDVAERYFVSEMTCWSIVDQVPLKSQFYSLPEVLLFDEFKATQNADNGLAFVFSDGLTHGLIDIVESRKQKDLMEYFRNFPRKVRMNVKAIVMDMNASYPALLALFPNAQLVIDGFHVIQQLTRAFNKLRVKEMNRLKKLPEDNGKMYRKLKKYWRQLLKWNGKVDYFHRKQYPLFHGEWRSESEVIEKLLTFSQVLQEAHEVLQNCLDAFKEKDPQAFFDTIKQLPKSLPDDFKKSCRFLLKQEEAIRRGIVSPWSNGPLEGKNNLSKVIKRIAFGFGRFDHLRKRILLQQQLSMEG